MMKSKAEHGVSGTIAMKRNITDSAQVFFRTNRMFREDGSWYFRTREEHTVGPFRDELAASTQLEIYIRLVKAGLLRVGKDQSLVPTARKRVG
jgi:hypothetical protein